MDFIAIDIGTSGCKASIVSECGIPLASAARRYDLLRSETGWASLDLRLLWEDVQSLLRELAPHARDVRALAVSSLGETVALLDKTGALLAGEGITYLDRRNLEMWNQLHDKVDPQVLYRTTGKIMPQIATVNHCLWWQQQHPEIWENVSRLLSTDSYIAHQLCGEDGLDYSSASNSLLYDINRHAWSAELGAAFQCDPALYPSVGRLGTPLAPIRRELCDQLGLPYPIQVLTGCHDQIVATLGAGATVSSEATLGEGSTEALNLVQDRAFLPRLLDAGLPIEPFSSKDRYLVMYSRFSHGTCLKWFVRTFAEEWVKKGGSALAYQRLNDNCPDSAGDVVFLPYMTQTCYYADVNQLAGTFLGLSSDTSREQMYRAVLEGLSFETSRMVNNLRAKGVDVRALTATGGATASKPYMQIKANVMNMPLRVLNNAEAGILGLAMVCAVEMGCYRDLEEAAAAFSRHMVTTVYTPSKPIDASRYVFALDSLKRYYLA